MHFLVDPVVFAIPTKDSKKEIFKEYARCLSLWEREFRGRPDRYLVSRDYMYALSQTGNYPVIANLRQVAQLLLEAGTDPKTIFGVCHGPLGGGLRFEEFFSDINLDDVLVENNDFLVDPNLLNRLPTSVADTFRAALGRLAYAKAYTKDVTAQSMGLVTHPIENNHHAAIEATLMFASRVETEVDTEKVSTNVPLFTSPEQVIACEKLADIWQDTRRAIEWQQYHLTLQDPTLAQTDFPPYLVADTFNESVLENHLYNNGGDLNQIFRKIVLLLAGKIPFNTRENHTLHLNNQIVERNWGAWRMHITGNPISLRLHYWRCQVSNRIILMQVAPYENFDIAPPPAEFDQL